MGHFAESVMAFPFWYEATALEDRKKTALRFEREGQRYLRHASVSCYTTRATSLEVRGTCPPALSAEVVPYMHRHSFPVIEAECPLVLYRMRPEYCAFEEVWRFWLSRYLKRG